MGNTREQSAHLHAYLALPIWIALVAELLHGGPDRDLISTLGVISFQILHVVMHD